MAPKASLFRRFVYATYRVLPEWLRLQLVRHLTPNYTLGAVVLLTDERNRLLLGRKPRKDTWCLPGGLLDRGEHPQQTARRELQEEAGITLPLEAFVATNPSALVDATAQQVDFVFRASADSAEVTPAPDGVEMTEIAWHPLVDLPPLTQATSALLTTYQMT